MARWLFSLDLSGALRSREGQTAYPSEEAKSTDALLADTNC